MNPRLRSRPIGVVPFETETDHTVVIACSKEAKARGVKNVMGVKDAKKACPDILLVPQQPEMYRRAHNALCCAIESVIPIDKRKSIDELTCRLDRRGIAEPAMLTDKIKAAIRRDVGEHITCSVGMAANRHLAKIACKMNKPDGLTVWHPEIMPRPLYPLTFDDIPGIGGRMSMRLWNANIMTMKALLETQPKQMRKLWGNVTGERLWYALNGYAIKAQPAKRGMYGHGRVLPPELRSQEHAYNCSRILLIKAARRMRRDGYYATSLHVWVQYRIRYGQDKGASDKIKLYCANDDQAAITALNTVWGRMRRALKPSWKIVRIGVWFDGLVSAEGRQLDILLDDDVERQKWERLTQSMDSLNTRYGRSVVTLGAWHEKKYGDHLGTKISFTRIPSAEDAF